VQEIQEEKMNKRGQAVYLAAIIGLAVIIAFFLALPALMSFLNIGLEGTNQPFTKLLIGLIPIFIFVMIIILIIKIARSE